jgi:hypothetical protein
MFSDKKFIVVLEYVIGFSLLMAVVPLFAEPGADWSDARWWAYLLFIVGFGLTLISCATGMKQRIELSQRISKIEKALEGLKNTQSQTFGLADPQQFAAKQFVGSLS